MATIAVLSQKGGTGKTTAVRTLTDIFRRIDLRVLAVDLDPQGNLSDYLDVPSDAPNRTAKTNGRQRDSMHDDTPSFVVRDGNYVSARWPGDVHAFAKTMAGVIAAQG